MLSYLMFHVVFVLPVLLGAAILGRRAYHRRPKTTLLGILLMTGLALLYTTPWDNHLIAIGAWEYGDGVVTMRIWEAPIGEYLFFVLQAILTGSWASYVFRHRQEKRFRIDVAEAVVGGAAGFLVALVGLAFVFLYGGTLLYLGAILAWAGPVLALQWAFGWRHLVEHWRPMSIAFGLPTAYLFVIDSFAIANGLWYLSETKATGILFPVIGLPLEEAVFFVVTNLFITQGLFLLYWVSDQTPYFSDYRSG